MEIKSRSGKVLVCTATGILAALTVREILERIGIPVFFHRERFNEKDSSRSGRCGEVHILVPEEHEWEVRGVLKPAAAPGEIIMTPA